MAEIRQDFEADRSSPPLPPAVAVLRRLLRHHPGRAWGVRRALALSPPHQLPPADSSSSLGPPVSNTGPSSSAPVWLRFPLQPTGGHDSSSRPYLRLRSAFLICGRRSTMPPWLEQLENGLQLFRVRLAGFAVS